MLKNPLCIYHGKCADGFTAAWAVWRAQIPGMEFYPGVYNDPPPDVTDRDVIIVDFSYKRPVLEEMAKIANSILILDHHKTAQADLSGFAAVLDFTDWQHHIQQGIKVCALFDMNRSGAGIAWDFFFPALPRPRIVDYAEDRDLWRFKLYRSREVSAAVFSWEYAFSSWDMINEKLTNRFEQFADEGFAIERKHRRDVAELIEGCKRRIKIAGHEVWGANLPYTYSSDAGHLMGRGEPFAACYWDTPEGRVFSLRSADDGLDVSDIAKQYGGGGHARAAGFRVPLDQIAQFEI